MRKVIMTALWFGTLGSLCAQEPLATIECREYLGRDWRRTLVTYYVQGTGVRRQGSEGAPAEGSPAWVRIKGKVRPESLQLLDAAGRAVPFQLSRLEVDEGGNLLNGRLSFMAELAKNSNYVYRLVSGAPAAGAPAGVKVSNSAEGLVLDNGVTAIRLPPLGPNTFEKTLAFGAVHQDMVKLYGKQAANGIAPGPLQGVRLSDGRWVGGSYFQANDPAQAPRVLGYTCTMTEQGPMFTEARVRYVFDGERHYQMTVRLLPGDPAIRVDEQFDMKRVGSTKDWRGYSSNDWQVVMSLTSGWQPDGWKPDSAFWERYSYGSALITQNIPLEAKLKELGFEFKSADYGTHSVVYDQPSTVIFGVEPWCPWGAFAGYFGLVQGGKVDRLENTPFLAVVPMHAGSWRMDGPYNWKKFVGHQGDDAALHWPLDAFRHPNVITHTGEYDPQVPWTFCRRIWALVGGPLQTFKTLHAFRSHEGYISLDQYKDWQLDWTDDPKVTYPRLFFTAADVQKVKPALDSHPAASLLKTTLYFNDDEKRRNELWARLTGLYGPFGIHNQTEPDLTYYFTLFRQGHTAEEWLAPMDELLSSPSLTAEQRKTLRRRIAAFCCLASEPDFNPRGSMSHLGNPNMAINRFLAVTFAAALVPDHPRAKDWMDVSEQYVRFKLAANVAPGGAWSELFTYYDASAPALIHGANILRNAGRCSDSVAQLAVEAGRFPLYFLSPRDPRYGVRLIPCWGHEGRESFGQWLPVAGLTRKTSPETAREAVWAWDQLGRLAGFHDGNFNGPCVLFADVLAGLRPDYAAPGLKSAWFPGVGAALRSHAGDPNETYLSYRQGYMISHCDSNQGDFILHAKGAPLIDMGLFAYSLHQHEPYIALNKEFGFYSMPRFGTRDNVSDVRQGANQTDQPGDWNPSSEIHSHSFGESVDYLRGHSDNQGRRWTRQIAFLKGKAAAGSNYFLFRDSTDSLNGDAKALVPYWWNFRTVGTKGQVAAAANEVNYTSAFGPRLNVHFLQPATIRAETREASREGQTLGHSNAWKSATSAIVPNQANWIKVTEMFSMTSVGPIDAGKDALVVLYPQGKDEAVPKYEPLADGVAKITTSEGIDYVFVDRKSMTFTNNDVSFVGKCGAVRIYPNEVHLVIAEGPGEVRYQGVTVRSPKPVTRVFKTGDTAKVRIIEEPADKTSIRVASARGDREELAPGVVRTTTKHGFVVTVEAAEPLTVSTNGVTFTGRRGSVEVNDSAKTVRLVMLDGETIGGNGLMAWGGRGPYEVVFYPDRVEGKSDGEGRFVCLSQPAGVDKFASLEVDGQTYAPGTVNTIDPAIAARAQGPDSLKSPGGTLVIPLMPGSHSFKVQNLAQPTVWRNWQLW